jgi:putative transcription factor
MNCEICGREITRGAVSVKIEGSMMRTCSACARHGERVVTKRPPSKNRPAPKKHVVRPEKTVEIVDDYSSKVRRNRERLGLTQDQLGSRLNEKGSVISRIESGHMTPDLKMAKKLGRFLGITLLEELES